MRIRHLFPSTTSRHEVNGPRTFLLRNQVGDYLSFSTERQSRYEGWAVWQDDHFLKLVERVEATEAGEVVSLTNTGASCYWEYKSGIKLGWKPLATLSGFTLTASAETTLRVTLDVRQLYRYPDFERSYEVLTEREGLLVRYTDTNLDVPVYLHVRSRTPFTVHGRWEACTYPRDAARHSEPSTLYSYVLAESSTTLLAFGYGPTPEEARRASLAATKQRPIPPPLGINHTMDSLLNQVNTARACVTQSLRWLESPQGIWAGLPWFHQVWSRDELIASLGLNHSLQHEVIDTYLGHALKHGELPTYLGSGTTCADGVGWLCLLVREYNLDTLPQQTKQRLVHFLQAAHQGLRNHHTSHHGLIQAGHNATWMDTIGREGFPLEVQTMYALLLELLANLTGEASYTQERLSFLGTIREHYWLGSHLADNLGDTTIRPNTFLAYLLQPDLLSEQLWLRTFDTTLRATLTPWGGLSSIDQQDARYQSTSTGEDNQSYHNGDSWFFLNNMAAVALSRLNTRRYGKVVTGILQSSTREILTEHMVGHAGEISSAAEMATWGCGMQAFSAGTYLWLVRELEGYSVGQTRDVSASFWDATADSTSASFTR